MARELKIRITGDQSGLKRAADDGVSILGNFGSKISAWSVASGQLLADGIKTGLGAVGGFLSDSIGGASDLNETMSKVGVLFGDASGTVEQFAAASATQFGQSKQEALDAAATFATFGKGAGLAGEDLAKFSTDFVGLASDMASFGNTSTEQAIEAIGAALRGEAEPIRAYGVLLDDATLRQKALELGIVSTTKDALTPQQKVLAAQAAIFAQTTDAQGDFARTSGGLANQQRILGAQFANLKTTIGQAFLPVMLDVVKVVNSKVIPLFQKWGPIISDEVVGSIRALISGFRNFEDGATSSGIAGFFEQVGIKAGEFVAAVRELVPKVAAIGSAIGDKLSGPVSWFIDNFGTIKELAITIGPPILAAVAGFKAFVQVQLAVAAVQKFTAAFKLASAAIWANPIGLAVAGIAALGAAFFIAYKRSEAFKNFVDGLAASVKGWWDGLVTAFRGGGLAAAAGYVWDGIKVAFGNLMTWLQTTALPWLGEKTLELAKKLGGWVLDGIVFLAENLPGWILAFETWYVTEAIPFIANAVWEFAKKLGGWIGDAVVMLKENLPGWIGAFTEWWVGTAVPAINEFTADAAVKMAKWVAEAALQLARNLPQWVMRFQVWAATEALPAIVRFGGDILMKLGEALAGAQDFLFDVGVEIVAGLIRGLGSMGGELRTFVQGFITANIPGPVRGILQIGSPSKVFHRIGVQTAEGLAGGLLAGSGMVSTAAGRLAGAAFTTVPFGQQRYGAADLTGGQQYQPASSSFKLYLDGRELTVAMEPARRQLFRQIR